MSCESLDPFERVMCLKSVKVRSVAHAKNTELIRREFLHGTSPYA